MSRSRSAPAARIVVDLIAAGYITRGRAGRRNRYAVTTQLQLPDRIAGEQGARAVARALGGHAGARPAQPGRVTARVVVGR